MKTFNANLNATDGVDYSVVIHSLSKGLTRSDIIQLFIAISKQVGKRKYLTDTVALRYNIATHSYQAIEKINGITAVLYDQIINKLDNTFGQQWGFFDKNNSLA